MADAFWSRRINPLRRDKPAPDNEYGIVQFAASGPSEGLYVAEGERLTGSAAELVDWIMDGAPAVYYTHAGKDDLLRVLHRSGALDRLLCRDVAVRVYATHGRTSALEIFAADDEQKPTTPHWSIRDIRIILPTSALAKQPYDALQQTAKRVATLRTEVHARFGTHLEMTATLTAYNAWRRVMPKPPKPYWRQPATNRTEVREAYHGGYTRMFSGGKHANVRHYDIRSAYPWAMRQGVPIGQPVAVGENADIDYPDVPGFYCIDVVIPRHGLPLLMAWGEDDQGHDEEYVIDPTSGDSVIHRYLWVTSQELALARELGIQNARVVYGWIYPDGIGRPFDSFVERCEAWRGQAKGAAEQAVKLMQNTLYGKFGSKPSHEEILLSAEMPESPEWMPYYGRGGLDVPIGAAWSRQVHGDSGAGVMLHWAAWIAATVRCRLIRAIRDIGPEHVIYADTDALMVDCEMVTGTRYGDWVLKESYDIFIPFAGKRYTGRLIDGTEIVRAAGLSGARDVVLEQLLATYSHDKSPP